MEDNILLDVRSLTTTFKLQSGSVVSPVDHNSFCVKKGEVVGLVGESGCGKSMTAMSLIRMVPPPGKVTKGKVIFNGTDILELKAKELAGIRGAHISMIFHRKEDSYEISPYFRFAYWKTIAIIRIRIQTVTITAFEFQSRIFMGKLVQGLIHLKSHIL